MSRVDASGGGLLKWAAKAEPKTNGAAKTDAPQVSKANLIAFMAWFRVPKDLIGCLVSYMPLAIAQERRAIASPWLIVFIDSIRAKVRISTADSARRRTLRYIGFPHTWSHSLQSPFAQLRARLRVERNASARVRHWTTTSAR